MAAWLDDLSLHVFSHAFFVDFYVSWAWVVMSVLESISCGPTAPVLKRPGSGVFLFSTAESVGEGTVSLVHCKPWCWLKDVYV